MINNLEGKKDYSYLKLQANYTKYILYLVVCLAIILIITHSNFTKNNSFILELAILIIACFVFYLIMKYTYDKFLLK